MPSAATSPSTRFRSIGDGDGARSARRLSRPPRRPGPLHRRCRSADRRGSPPHPSPLSLPRRISAAPASTAAALSAAIRARDGLRELSAERIGQEMRRLVVAPRAVETLAADAGLGNPPDRPRRRRLSRPVRPARGFRSGGRRPAILRAPARRARRPGRRGRRAPQRTSSAHQSRTRSHARRARGSSGVFLSARCALCAASDLPAWSANLRRRPGPRHRLGRGGAHRSRLARPLSLSRSAGRRRPFRSAAATSSAWASRTGRPSAPCFVPPKRGGSSATLSRMRQSSGRSSSR